MTLPHFANEKGVALIAAVTTLLVLSLVGTVVVSMVGTKSYSTLHQAQSVQALSLAEAGANRALAYLSKEGGACTDITGAPQLTDVALGPGTFAVTATRYNPASTTLSAAILDTDTTIPVASTAGYAPHGRITIDSEQIDYTAITGTSFSGVRRGANETTAASHSSGTPVNQDQCTITSTGTISAAFGDARRVSEVIVTGGPDTDPVTVVTNVPVGFFANTQHLTHYDGTYAYLFYEKNDTNIYWKYSSDNVTWSAEQTLSPSERDAGIGWDIWWENDTTGVLVVGHAIDTGDSFEMTFHKISIGAGPSITLSGAETTKLTKDFARTKSIALTMAGNRVFAMTIGDDLLVLKRDTDGFPNGTGTYTELQFPFSKSNTDLYTIIPYSTAKIFAVFAENAGGTHNDGERSVTWDGTTVGDMITIFSDSPSIESDRGVAGVRISDTDFRVVIASDGSTAGKLTDWQWNDSSWTSTVIDATNTTYRQPAMMRDTVNGDLYVFAQASGEANTPIYQYKNTGASSWGTRVAADDAESTARSIPVTQHSEPPPASSRTIPCKAVWAYRVANGTNFDLKVGTLSLDPSCGLSIVGWREVY